MTDKDAASRLYVEADQGRFDRGIIDAMVAESMAANPGDARHTGIQLLTPRERDVLRAISQGGTNKEVARQLALSPSTVRTHVENSFRNLGCTTRAAATLKASALGLL